MTSFIFPKEFNGMQALQLLSDGRFIVISINTLYFCSLNPSITNLEKPIPLIYKFQLDLKNEFFEQIFEDIVYEDKKQLFHPFESTEIETLPVSIKKMKAISNFVEYKYFCQTFFGILLSNHIVKFYVETSWNTINKIFDYSDLYENEKQKIENMLKDQGFQDMDMQYSLVYGIDIMNFHAETLMAIGHHEYTVIWRNHDLKHVEDWSAIKILTSKKLIFEIYFLPLSRKKLLCLSFIDGTASLHHLDSTTPVIEDLYTDQDEMPIHNYYFKDGRLFTSKGQFILIWVLDLDNESVIEQMYFKYIEDPSPYHIINICGLNNCIVVSKPDHISCFDAKSDLITEKNIHIDWNQSIWKIDGHTVSLNSAILICTLSPLIFYKIKEKKEKYKLHLSPQLNVESVIPTILSNEKPLRYIYDLLFIVRNEIFKNHWPAQILDLLKDENLYSQFSLPKLKLIRYFFLLKASTKYDYKLSNEKAFNNLERLIICKHLSSALSLISCEDFLSNQKKLSMSLMKMYLERKNLTDTEVIDEIISEPLIKLERNSEPTLDLDTPMEMCGVCGKNILFDSIHISKCENGHLFGRCSQTLLTCFEIPYRKCTVCSSMAKKISDEDGLKNISSDYCTLCDAPLTIFL